MSILETLRHSALSPTHKNQFPVNNPHTGEEEGQAGRVPPNPQGCRDMTNKLQADSVSKTYWEFTLSFGLAICATPEGAGFPGCSGSKRESPPVPGQICELRPSVRLPEEMEFAHCLPGSQASLPREGPGLCPAQRR